MEKRKRGGQPGNKNAVGNRGGGAPFANQNAITHGAYSTWERLKRIRQSPELFDGLDLINYYERYVKLNQIFICEFWNLESEHNLAILATSGFICRLMRENGRLLYKLEMMRYKRK